MGGTLLGTLKALWRPVFEPSAARAGRFELLVPGLLLFAPFVEDGDNGARGFLLLALGCMLVSSSYSKRSSICSMYSFPSLRRIVTDLLLDILRLWEVKIR